MQIFLVAFFGALGVVGRYIVDREIGALLTTDFPLSTLLINCTGSFLIGVISVIGTESGLISKDIFVMLSVGLLGGFTTMSAFSLQTFQLIEKGQLLFATTYFVGTPALGVVCAITGIQLARMLLAT